MQLLLSSHATSEACISLVCNSSSVKLAPWLEQNLTGFAGLQLAAKKGLLGESSFQRLNLAILAASAVNTVLFVSNSATAGECFAFVTANLSYYFIVHMFAFVSVYKSSACAL